MFDKDLIILSNEDFKKKEDVIDYLSKLSNDNVEDATRYRDDVLNREETISTYVGYGIAIPHAMSTSVTTPFVVYLQLGNEMTWDLGEDQVKHVFMIGVPKENGSTQHLKILSELSKNLMRYNFRDSLLNAKDAETIYGILSKLEKEMQVI